MKKVIAMRIFFFKYVACLRFCFCTSQLVPSLAFAFNQKMLLAYFTAKPKIFRNNFITVLVASSSVVLSTGLYLYELIRFWLDCCKYSLPLSVTISFVCLSPFTYNSIIRVFHIECKQTVCFCIPTVFPMCICVIANNAEKGFFIWFSLKRHRHRSEAGQETRLISKKLSAQRTNNVLNEKQFLRKNRKRNENKVRGCEKIAGSAQGQLLTLLSLNNLKKQRN